MDAPRNRGSPRLQFTKEELEEWLPVLDEVLTLVDQQFVS